MFSRKTTKLDIKINHPKQLTFLYNNIFIHLNFVFRYFSFSDFFFRFSFSCIYNISLISLPFHQLIIINLRNCNNSNSIMLQTITVSHFNSISSQLFLGLGVWGFFVPLENISLMHFGDVIITAWWKWDDGLLHDVLYVVQCLAEFVDDRDKY